MTTTTLTRDPRRQPRLGRPACRVDGRLVTPADADWQQVRTPWLVNVDQQPAAVLEVANVPDVVNAVRWAIQSGISVTAQPSGHAPRTTLDDTLLLRTRALRGIAVDVEERSAVVGAGVKWGELMRELDGTGLIALWPAATPTRAWSACCSAAASAGSPASTASPPTASSPSTW